MIRRPLFDTQLIDRARWLDIAQRSPDATFFHTPIWASIATGKADPKCLGVVLATGGVGALPGLVQRIGPFLLVESSPFGTYGGLIASTPLDRQTRASAYERLGVRRSVVRCSVVETHDFARGRLEEWNVAPDQTHVLSLAGVTEDELWEAMDSKRRRDVRKADERGVSVRRGVPGDDWRTYFDVYEDSLRRWGVAATSEYRWEVFERLEAASVDHPAEVQLWLATVNEGVAAGGIVLTWNGRAVYWHGASMTSLRHYSASSLLVWKMISHARSTGCHTFDFNPSGGHEGVARFKEQFGAHTVEMSRLTLDSRLGGAISTGTGVVRRLVRKGRQIVGHVA